MSFFSLVFTLFLLIDAPGNIPFYLAILKDIHPTRQKKIIVREMIFALITMILFVLIGQKFLSFLHVHAYSIQVAGGIVLFLIALKMIFPGTDPLKKSLDSGGGEPFLVPLAIPLVAGPGLLTALMIYAEKQSDLRVMFAAIIAWILSLIVLFFAPYLSQKMGKKGIIAIERLMGLILILVAVDMFLEGFKVLLTNG